MAPPDVAPLAPPDVLVVDVPSVPDVPDVPAARMVSLEEASSFTDAPVLAALARDPRWRPGDWESPDAVLSCEGSLHPQSCTANPCYEHGATRCRTRCGDRCHACDGGCRGAAERCALPCADDACRLACARTNGACLDACIRAKDQCVTGVCDPAQQICEREQERSFYFGTCRPTCLRCAGQCEMADNMGDCYRRCFRRTPGCSADLQSICVMNGGRYGEPSDAEAP